MLTELGVTGVEVTDDRVTGQLPEPEAAMGGRADDGPDGGPGGGAPRDVAELNAALVHAGVRVRGFGTARASLEEVFVRLTGEGFDVAG